MKKISIFLILIGVFLVFRKLFLPGPAVFGDAPYFYKEGLKELVSFPTVWISRGNTMGGINLFLWIYPLMVLYGVLGTFLHLSNDLIIRILFYFPSLIFGFGGVYFFTKYLKFSKTVQFVSIVVYLVNTYYLLLIDGGQVGVVLAYGLFPLILFFLIKVVDKPTLGNFVTVLISSFILSIVDFRIAVVCFLTAFVWKISKLKKLWILILVGACLLGLSSYWVIPILKLAVNGGLAQVSGLQTTSLLNSLLLFSPNWPANEFGKTVAPYFYFVLVPILIFLPLFVFGKKEIIWLTFIFLIFAFLVKGESAPFGFFYSFLVKTEVGSVFRDSTKFFIPLILIAGILIGKTVELVKNKIFAILIFFWILFLVGSAILGKLNGVLGKNTNLADYQKVYQEISKQKGFLRSAWFIEKSPFAYHSEETQALDAKDLVNFRPLAAMNVGTGDRFNFVNNSRYLDWFDLLGIKYLIFNGNPRVSTFSKGDQEDWDRLMNLISKDDRLQKLNIGTDFPVYQNPSIKPHQFFVNKTFLVVGADDIYGKLEKLDKNFSVGNQGFLFAEDGKLDLSNLQATASSSAVIVFNNKNQEDLKMGFLQKNFVSPTAFYKNEWSVFSASQYLDYKFQLLIREIEISDFDYGLGIALSTKKGEKISFKLDVPDDGNYVLAVRKMDEKNQGMHWVFENKSLKKGVFEYVHENKIGIEVLNVVALIPVNGMRVAEQLTQNFLGTFAHLDLNNQEDQVKIKQILENDKWENLENGQATKQGWIIYTDSFNDNWKLQRRGKEDSSLPMFSMVNGFYVDPSWGDVKIIFKGQEYVRWGVYFSVLSFLVIAIVILWISAKNERKDF